MMKPPTVFMFPMTLDFYLADRKTYKQLLTLYNPHDFDVTFNVLSTSPHKFTVLNHEGTIAFRSSVDVVIRYTQPSNAHCNTTDKFRVTMNERDTKTFLGKRDVTVRYFPGEPDVSTKEMSTDASTMESEGTIVKNDPFTCNHPAHRQTPVNLVVLFVAIVCIIALILPTQPEEPVESTLPQYLHLSTSIKLVSAFVLGLSTMVILKP